MKPEEFLSAMAETATRYDLDAHMALISKDVKVFGIPGFEEITYDDWFNQCKEEFENKVLQSVSYKGMQISEDAPNRKIFKSIETVEGSDGKVNTYTIEFVISKESDGQWRLAMERILPNDGLAAN